MAIALGIAAILAALALPAIDFNRYRMDANARLVQNRLIWAQSQAVQRNMQILVQLHYDENQFRIVEDSTTAAARVARKAGRKRSCIRKLTVCSSAFSRVPARSTRTDGSPATSPPKRAVISLRL